MKPSWGNGMIAGLSILFASVTVFALAFGLKWSRERDLGIPTPASDEGQTPQPMTGGSSWISTDLYQKGRYVFERNCQVCHGRWGDGRGEMALGMRPRPRDFTAGLFKFRSTPSGFLPTDLDLERTIRGGIANSSMPAFGPLSDPELKAVVAYLKTFSPNWSQPERHWAPIPAPAEPEWLRASGPDYVGAEGHRDAGARLYQTHCAVCHGPEADGKSELAPSLEDVWGQPCPPADLRTPGLKSGTEPADLHRVLSTGLDGSPMPSFAETLTVGQRWEVVAYLLRRRSVP